MRKNTSFFNRLKSLLGKLGIWQPPPLCNDQLGWNTNTKPESDDNILNNSELWSQTNSNQNVYQQVLELRRLLRIQEQQLQILTTTVQTESTLRQQQVDGLEKRIVQQQRNLTGLLQALQRLGLRTSDTLATDTEADADIDTTKQQQDIATSPKIDTQLAPNTNTPPITAQPQPFSPLLQYPANLPILALLRIHLENSGVFDNEAWEILLAGSKDPQDLALRLVATYPGLVEPNAALLKLLDAWLTKIPLPQPLTLIRATVGERPHTTQHNVVYWRKVDRGQLGVIIKFLRPGIAQGEKILLPAEVEAST